MTDLRAFRAATVAEMLDVSASQVRRWGARGVLDEVRQGREHRRRQLEERMAAGIPTEDGLVFVRSDGRPYHGSKLTALLYPILDRLGLPRVHVHDLRHSAATILYGAGVPIEAIGDMLGHSTTRVTADLYRHRVAEIQTSLADRMQEAVG